MICNATLTNVESYFCSTGMFRSRVSSRGLNEAVATLSSDYKIQFVSRILFLFLNAKFSVTGSNEEDGPFALTILRNLSWDSVNRCMRRWSFSFDFSYFALRLLTFFCYKEQNSNNYYYLSSKIFLLFAHQCCVR